MFSRHFLFLLPLVLVVATTGVVSAPVPDPMDTSRATLSQPSRLTARAGESSGLKKALEALEMPEDPVLSDATRKMRFLAYDAKDIGTFIKKVKQTTHIASPNAEHAENAAEHAENAAEHAQNAENAAEHAQNAENAAQRAQNAKDILAEKLGNWEGAEEDTIDRMSQIWGEHAAGFRAEEAAKAAEAARGNERKRPSS